MHLYRPKNRPKNLMRQSLEVQYVGQAVNISYSRAVYAFTCSIKDRQSYLVEQAN
jgi:hypothetical protein